MVKKKYQKRISSLIMSALIVAQNFAYLPPMIATAARSAKVSDTENFPEVSGSNDVSAILHHTDQLVDNGDGTFTFTSEITSSYSYFDQSGSRLKFQDGEYVLDKAGTYLVELWGGDGGEGSSLFPLSFKAGKGGSGGFVYGLLKVETDDVGKKLSYEIGSKGLSQTRSVTGGGTNGDGGGAGDIAVFSVGAGGGYSAVYLLDAGETINDEKRNDPSKVLMIAGGGGGGGAGAALHTLPGLFGGEGKANGGQGGTFESSLSGKADITPNFTEDSNTYGAYIGTYYAGENGTTSGTKGAYVGVGGTDRPGEIVKSFIGFLEASSYPNDWQQTYHPDLNRGVGGAGNFRGGGGGAGFAGGSGGMQNEPLDARNVGGGGGGSSYIGNFSNFTPGNQIDINNSAYSGYFVQESGNTNSDVGGAVVIRYLSPTSNNYDYLNNITVSGQVSQYFDIVGDEGNSSFSAEGSVAPVASGLAKGQQDKKLTLTLKLKPKAGFFGGNNVPIFASNTLSVESTVDSDKTCSIDLSGKPEVTHVNVPYNIDIQTKNSTIGSGASIHANNLYATGYSEIAYDDDDPMQDFISAISYDIVANNTSEPASDFSYTFTGDDVNTTKTFTVRATLTPKYTAAQVGDAGSNQITKNAYVKCVDDSKPIIDDFEVEAEKKTLTYDSNHDTYDLKIDTKYKADDSDTFYVYDPISTETTPKRSTLARASVRDNNNCDPQTESKTLSPGIYYIEAYGADGGKGGDHSVGLYSANGNPGGLGDYVSGYLILSEETVVTIHLGPAGYNGSSGFFSGASYYCGGGGGYSGIYINNQPVLIAGGGGGGGAPYGTLGFSQPSSNGNNAGFNATNTDGVRDDASLAPKNIYCGENGYWDTGSNKKEKVAKGGQNFKSDDIIDAPQLPENVIPLDVSSSTGLTKATLNAIRNTPAQDEGSSNIKAGAVRITKLGVKGGYYHGTNDSSITLATSADVANIEAQLKANVEAAMNAKADSFTLTETYNTDYFDIISADDGTINGDGTVTFTDAVSIENDRTGGNDYQTDTAFAPVDGLSYTTTRRTYTYSITAGETSHTVKLRPKDGFLGGNDVQLLTSATLEHYNNNDDLTDDSAAIPPLDYTDYVNVRLAEENLDNIISTDQKYVNYGTELTASLLSTNTANYPPAVEYSWQDDHADYQSLIYEPDIGTSITEDTDCFVTATLKANSAANKASVIDAVDAASRTFKIPVKVKYPINTSGLTHTTQTLTSGADELTSAYFPTKDDDSVLLITVTAEDGYDLPLMTAEENPEDAVDHDERVINIRGLKNGTYADMEKKDGVLYISIPRDIIEGPVIIEGAAYEKTHSVKFMYQRYDPLTKQVTMVQSEKTGFANGAILDNVEFPPTPVEGECPKGYDTNNFWDWTIEKTDGHYRMGQEDVMIVGTYKPITYRLLIKYINDDTEAIMGTYLSPERSNYDEDTDTYDIALTKDAEYSVTSPEFEGYVPDKPIVSGKVTDEVIASMENFEYDSNTYHGLVVEVRYTASTGNVNVHFIGCDIRGVPNGETLDMISINAESYDLDTQISTTLGNSRQKIRVTKLVTNDDKTVEETVDHVSGNASSETATYYVYYRAKPETVTVQFMDGDNSEPIATKICEIGREYSYNHVSNTYDSLPRAVKTGYRLVGWENKAGQTIEDDMIVQGNAGDPITLYAKWESSKVTITVRYLYANNIENVKLRGDGAGITKNEDYEYGSSYSIKSYVLSGYSAEPETVKGYALENKTETVYYLDNPDDVVTITVNVYSESYENDTSGAPKLCGGTFGLFTESGEPLGEQENTDGTLVWDNIAYNIESGNTYVVKCIDPPFGYGTAQIPIAAGESKNMFLGKSPFELPFAGSTPLTVYTVTGISIMALAVFLFFNDRRRKTEYEKNETI